jgi:peptidoglycan/LPS O-acetylase OafA/YrhL
MAPGGNSGTAARGRVPALDGLRALAVVAVLLFHSQLAWARGGFLGVSAFFTLSGFLITSLLLHERLGGNRGHLRTFWIRRARRLLPAALVTLFGVTAFAATVATPDQLRVLRGDMFAALGYVANWRFYLSGQSYADLFRAPSPVLHFWSLAIEEQFYVIFPLVVVGTLWLVRRWTDLRRRQVLGGLLVAGIAASVIASRVLYAHHGSTRAYYGTDTRAAELLVGALLAVIVAGRITPSRVVSARARIAANVAGGAALGLMLWWWATVAQSTAWLYRGGFAVHASCAAVVIVAARIDGPFARALAWRPLAALGLISYGVYLYHWPIFLWLTPERTGLAAVPLFALRVALTLGVAIVSFRLLERPILTGTFPTRARRRRLAPALLAIPTTVAALVIALLLVTASLPAPNIVFAPVSAHPSALTSETSPNTALIRERTTPATPPKPTPLHRAITLPRPLRVLVVGDSVGQTFGRGLELWALQTQRAIVENDAVPMCALGRTLEVELPLGGMLTPSDGCAGWDEQWPQTIASFDPDVVIVQYAVWEVESRKLPDGRLARPGDPELDRWQLSEYQTAADILSAQGAPVVWVTSACEGDPIRPGEPFWSLDYGTIPALARSRDAVHVFDLNHLLCTDRGANPDFGGVTGIRPDGAHFTDAGALAIAQWLMPIVLGDAPAPTRIFPQY